MEKTFIIQGMCYSGKTTLGQMLSHELNLNFLDSRNMFFKKFGLSEIDYLEKYGKHYFKEAEKKTLQQNFKGIVSCSGSSIYYPDEMEKLNKKYEIIWLDVDFDIIKKRKLNEEKKGIIRPILFPDHINSFKELYDERSKLYKKYYTYRIYINSDETPETPETPSETLKKILNTICY